MELKIIRGINEKREKDFNSLNVYNTADLMRFFPRAYIDLREKQPLKNAYHNEMILTTGKVLSLPTVRYYRRGGLIKIVCEQEGYIFPVIWFNQPYVASKLKVGEEYLFYGRVRMESGVATIVNPSFELCDRNFRLKGIVPRYSIKGNLTQKCVRDAIRLAVDVEKPTSIIPSEMLTKYQLSSLYSAYKEVHNPTSFESSKLAADRIAVEEYFALISAFKVIKGGREHIRVNKYNCSSKELVQFVSESFPFEFTDGQKQAVNEIYADMTSKNVMNRLVQGDVGCGKTAVSMCAIFIAVKSGSQVAMLAPTEVLASQNYKAIKKVFSNYNVELLVGSMSAKEKNRIKADLKNGKIDIIVGTHAILQQDVEFNNLTLCICDEQQRFGVAQRSSLVDKGFIPDMLVMSATPIPRTLALIFYGDLDITTISVKPKNRQPVQTNIVQKEKYADMLKFIEKECEQGKQAYFVCQRIDGDEEGSIISVTETYEKLKSQMKNVRIGLLHGKMKDVEKNAIMEDFKNKQIDVLVSTTVIEVGVDVPSATIMVILNAERFGLSQLHQLRGRVGRSDLKSYCFLTMGNLSEQSLERLNVLKNNSDGFKISEYDYKMRGSGDFIGDRQSGKFMNDLGNLNYSTESIFLAKKISDEAFMLGKNLDKIKAVAVERYEKLKDITLN